MGNNSRFDNEITITPPLTWQECRVTPGLENAQLRIDERVIDGVEGQTRILTAPAIIAGRHCFGPHLLGEIQAVIDCHPKHEFAGFIEEWLEPGYRMLPRRYIVRDRKVVCVTAEWPGGNDTDERVEDARAVALACKNILNQMPVMLSDFFEDDWNAMPDWFTGEDNGNELWVGEG